MELVGFTFVMLIYARSRNINSIYVLNGALLNQVGYSNICILARIWPNIYRNFERNYVHNQCLYEIIYHSLGWPQLLMCAPHSIVTTLLTFSTSTVSVKYILLKCSIRSYDYNIKTCIFLGRQLLYTINKPGIKMVQILLVLLLILIFPLICFHGQREYSISIII